MNKFEKPRSFYSSFDRKESAHTSTTYCPGCGHGITHKLIARAIDALGIQDRTIMLSPVGCSVFLYYYFDTGNIQCSHGRAPAVATGIRSTLKDAIVVCYQGDGDLAGIGTTEIIHAANRGENITVFFVNNAIYGMTGGQMAPTTLVGQQTVTTPHGRSLRHDGSPIGMAELISSLHAPVYVERVSLSSPASIKKAEKAILKGFQNQIDKKGFSFVEILSPCPINWKMEPPEAFKWIKSHLEPVFPAKLFRDTADTTPVMADHSEAPPWLDDHALHALLKTEKETVVPPRTPPFVEQRVKMGGFGGQGIMSAGILLANCAVAEGMHATWLPSYGPEMRGGTANASIVMSQEEIGSPVVEVPDVLIAMNTPSLEAFEHTVKPGGTVVINSSIIHEKITRSDIRAIYIPASELAKECGFIGGACILLLSVYVLAYNVVSIETIKSVLPWTIKKHKFLDLNLAIVQRAVRFYEENKNTL